MSTVDYTLPIDLLGEERIVLVDIRDEAGSEELDGLRRNGFHVIDEFKGFSLLKLQNVNVISDDRRNAQEEEVIVTTVVVPVDFSADDSKDDEDDDYRGRPEDKAPPDEWEYPCKSFYMNTTHMLDGEEELTVGAIFKTVWSSHCSDPSARKLRLSLDLVAFQADKANRIVHGIDIEVKPADDSEWVRECLAVEAWPDATMPQELNLQTLQNRGIEASASKTPGLKLSASQSVSTTVKVSQHQWISNPNWKHKSVVWKWALRYWRDGRTFDPAKAWNRMNPQNQLRQLLPIQRESVQLSGDQEDLEAAWTLNAALDGLLAFDVNITLHTTVIHHVPFWKRCFVCRAVASQHSLIYNGRIES